MGVSPYYNGQALPARIFPFLHRGKKRVHVEVGDYFIHLGFLSGLVMIEQLWTTR